MSDDRQAWERQSGESSAAFHAFCHYRNQAQHSLRDAYREHWSTCLGNVAAEGDQAGIARVPEPKQHPSSWKRWSIEHRWVARVQTYDGHLDGEKRKVAEAEILAMAQAHAREAQLSRVAILTVARNFVTRLQDPTFASELQKLTPRQYLKAMGILRLLPQLQHAERLARGAETQIIKLKHEQTRDEGQSLADLVDGNPGAGDLLAELMERLTTGGGEPGGAGVAGERSEMGQPPTPDDSQ